MRLSSLRCYNQIKADGLLSACRFAVYDVLVANGPATAGELHEKMWRVSGRKMARNDLAGRLKELKELGVATEAADMRECHITGRMCLVWDVVDGLPNAEGLTKRVPSKTRIAELEKRISELEAENALLLKQNSEKHKSIGRQGNLFETQG